MKRFGFIVVLVCTVLTLHAQSNVLLKSDFEDNTVGLWANRGSTSISASDKGAHTGKYGLLTTGRTQSWNGPSIDLTGKIFMGGVYSFSAWVKIAEGQPDAEIIMTVQREKGGSQGWDRVASLNATTGVWVNITGSYEPNTAFDSILMYIESPIATLQFYIDDITLTAVKEPQKSISAAPHVSGLSVPSLWETYKNHFVVGTAIELNQINGAQGQLLLKHFNGVTPENIMKPEYMAPSEGTFNFTTADMLVAFASQNKLQLRGHTLLWHTQNAKWMFYDAKGNKVTKAVLLKRLETYITTIVSRYKGKVYAWDVVNEVVEGSGLRNSEWLEIAGEEYIERAFQYARKADPNAKLFINDYDTTDPVKGETLYRLVKKLRDKKIPVDGVGMQFHISLTNPGLQSIRDSLRKFSDLGVEIHITELDMSLNADPKVTSGDAPPEVLIRQGHRYKELFEIFTSFPAIKNVTFWGFHDGHTWLTGHPVKKADWPLPFDANLVPKYAYWGLTDPSKLPPDVTIAVKRNNQSSTAPKGTPVIDGKEDDVWKKSPVMNITLYIEGNGAAGTGKALWDDKNLYVFIKVIDPVLSLKSRNAHEQDSVEIFVDEKNNKSPEYLEDDAQYRINYENVLSTRGFPSEIKSVAVVTKEGYDIEVMIPLKFAKPAVGTAIGFDLQINDDSRGTGVRDSFSKWNDPTNESYINTSGFGTLVFGN